MRRVMRGTERVLAFEELGAGEPLLVIHGFTGSSHAWRPELKEELSRQRRVICVDLIGHGESSRPSQPEAYRLDENVEDLCAVLDACEVERALWVGYSMGGRIALGAAVNRPDRVCGLALEGASPGLRERSERRIRVASDEKLALCLEEEGLEAFVESWLKLPLFETQARLPRAERERSHRLRLANAPSALAACLRGLGTGCQPNFWPALRGIRIPVRLLVGEKDMKFRRIAARMQAELPFADTRILPGAGHTTNLEDPRAFAAALLEFSDQIYAKKGDSENEDIMAAGPGV